MKHNILLVEDDHLDFRLFEKAFSKRAKSINLIWKATGNEAIEYIAKNKTDLILLDLLLPDIDGTEVIHTIAELGVEIPVVILSQVSEPKRIIELLKQENVKDYFIKSDLIYQKNFANIVISIIEENQEKIKLKKLLDTQLGKNLLCAFLAFINAELDVNLSTIEGTLDLISELARDDNVKMGLGEMTSSMKSIRTILENRKSVEHHEVCEKFVKFIDDRRIEVDNMEG